MKKKFNLSEKIFIENAYTEEPVIRVRHAKKFIKILKNNSGLFCADMNNHTAFIHLIDKLAGEELI